MSRSMSQFTQSIRCVIWSVSAGLLLSIFPHHASAVDSPDFGVIWNDDGDLSFTSTSPTRSKRNLEFVIDTPAGTPVKTLCYSVGAGSDILLYPTRVASTWGWRELAYDKHPAWGPRIRAGRACTAAGMDAVRIAGERARKLGLHFVPSYRMNDDHFMFEPETYPLTGKFWLENQHLRIGASGKSPIKSREAYANLFDYSHAEVREYRLRVVDEILERYGDILSGLELDFMRGPYYFPLGLAEERAPRITDLVEKVRARLDRLGNERKRKLYLIVRVPPSLRNCKRTGLAVDVWLEKRLVDVVIPTQLMTTAFEMPLEEFVFLACPVGALVYAGLLDRVGWEWPFVEEPTEESYRGSASSAISVEMIRAAAANYYLKGAAGMSLFNMKYAEGGGWRGEISDALYRKIRDIVSPAALHLQDKVFPITKPYYLDHEDSYQYRKQLPMDLRAGKAGYLSLIVGDGLSGEAEKTRRMYTGLRLGFLALPPEAKLTVVMNGQTILSGPVKDHYTAVLGAPPVRSSDRPESAECFVQVTIDRAELIRQGKNEITVSLPAEAAAGTSLVDVQLGVRYETSFESLLERGER